MEELGVQILLGLTLTPSNLPIGSTGMVALCRKGFLLSRQLQVSPFGR
jgi:hypothetical protein